MMRPPTKASAPDDDSTEMHSAEMTEELWTSFHSRVKEYLQSITVADLLKQQGVQAVRDVAQAGRGSRSASRRAVRSQLPSGNVPNSVFALGRLGSA